jgi:hypothetical protein
MGFSENSILNGSVQFVKLGFPRLSAHSSSPNANHHSPILLRFDPIRLANSSLPHRQANFAGNPDHRGI